MRLRVSDNGGLSNSLAAHSHQPTANERPTASQQCDAAFKVKAGFKSPPAAACRRLTAQLFRCRPHRQMRVQKVQVACIVPSRALECRL